MKKVVAKLELDGTDRVEIEGQMSAAMGSYIQAESLEDAFAGMSEEVWNQLVSVCFDVCATAVLRKRIHVIGPIADSAEPPF